jgi:IS1 family transposase
MDELYTYVKKINQVRTAADRNKLHFSAFEVGSGESGTLRKLLNELNENNLKIVCTDGNPSCQEEENFHFKIDIV